MTKKKWSEPDPVVIQLGKGVPTPTSDYGAQAMVNYWNGRQKSVRLSLVWHEAQDATTLVGGTRYQVDEHSIGLDITPAAAAELIAALGAALVALEGEA